MHLKCCVAELHVHVCTCGDFVSASRESLHGHATYHHYLFASILAGYCFFVSDVCDRHRVLSVLARDPEMVEAERGTYFSYFEERRPILMLVGLRLRPP